MFEELGRGLDNLVKRMTSGSTLTQIDPKTDVVSADYPAGSPAKLRLEIAIGKLNVVPGGEKLVDGMATYNVQEWAPEVGAEGDTVTVKQGHNWLLWPIWGSMRNEWELKLGTARPYELSVTKGVAQGKLALGGLPLTSAQIDTGTGEATISFDSPNPQQADQVVIKSGTGEVKIDGLLNANAKNLSVRSGTGRVELGFTGEKLQQDTNADVSLGVGEAVIEIKPGVPTRVSLSQGLGNARVLGNFTAVGEHVYETPDFAAAAGPKLTMKIGSGVGSVTVRTAAS
jgi:hypothetical protein